MCRMRLCSDAACFRPRAWLQIKKIHSEPLSHLLFREDAIVTACRRGQVKVWVRPASSTGSGSSAPTTTTTTTDDAAAASS